MTSLLDPLPPEEWNRDAARHLLNRAGFGVPWARIDALAAMTPEGAASALVDYENEPEVLAEPDWLEPADAAKRLHRQIQVMEKMNAQGPPPRDELEEKHLREVAAAQRTKLSNELQAREREGVERLKRWWIRRMIYTNRPLQEKMTLFWHGHFATSAEKVPSARANYDLNALFRSRATGNFKDLTRDAGRTPAMLRYLDNDRNVREHPNENWARELMELFVLGQGEYTEDDVKEAARAFTGWTSDDGEFKFDARRHDDGEKTFLGKTGRFDGDAILDIVFERPAASRFVARKLWVYFAGDAAPPPDGVVDGLADTLRDGGYELKPMLRRMFASRAFHAPELRGAAIKSPAHLVVSAMAQLEIRVPPDHMVENYATVSMRAMGQDLFFPPNVKGWDGGRAWINTNTMMARTHFANFLVNGVATDVGGGGGRGIRDMLERIRAAAGGGGKSRVGRARAAMEMGMAGGQTMGGAAMQPAMGEGLDGMEGPLAGVEISPADLANVGLVGESNGPKGLKLPFAPFDARAFFARADGMELGAIVEFLADYFLGSAIDDARRTEVVEGLLGGAPPRAMNAAGWDVERLRGAVRLLLSAAEYQAC